MTTLADSRSAQDPLSAGAIGKASPLSDTLQAGAKGEDMGVFLSDNN